VEQQTLLASLEQATLPPLPARRDWRIGCVGAGFIMRDCQLAAYRDLGFQAHAITSLSQQESEAVAAQYAIPHVYGHWRDLLADGAVEVLDIAIPPHEQLAVVREACRQGHIRGILCQKPLSMSLADAREIVCLGKESGVAIAVNSNMRYDQSMRALHRLLSLGLLGEPVLASIDMRAIPHWQAFLRQYDRLELYGMGIHHTDVFRYLFGDPQTVTAVCRTDPRTRFAHTDGITQHMYQYASGLLATALDDVWAGPDEPCEKDTRIQWRVEGTLGLAKGTIGWPRYPVHAPSTLTFTCTAYPHQWLTPTWGTAWFPDAFGGTMSSLLCAIESSAPPEISAEDNLATIGCVEACYRSIAQKRTVALAEVLADA